MCIRDRSSTVKGKRVVLVDDSIVRGTTSARIIKLLRDAGAKAVSYTHLDVYKRQHNDHIAIAIFGDIDRFFGFTAHLGDSGSVFELSLIHILLAVPRPTACATPSLSTETTLGLSET